jgi:hypothetical protein
MATHNVRFYKLDQMPTFLTKHRGIFVWIPVKGSDNNGQIIKGYTSIDETNPSAPVYNGPIHFNGGGVSGDIEPGLWFGGRMGWELLTNVGDNLTEAQVNALIDAKLATLDAEFDIVNVQTSGNTTTVTFYGVEQLNGLVKQGNDASDQQQIVIGNGKLIIGKSDGSDAGSEIDDAVEVFSANSTTDAAIELGNGLTWDKNNMVIGVDTKTAVTGSNKIVTEADIAAINGAMHYKGGLNPGTTWPSAVEQGDVYVVTAAFTNLGQTFEIGDLIVFNSDGTYQIVQSNLTIGNLDGQIAKNVGNLTTGDIVYATTGGIATYAIQPSDIALKSTSTRQLTLNETDADSDEATLNHAVEIVDALQVGGKSLTQTLSIATPNQSIDIQTGTNSQTSDPEISIDLVWKEHIDL